MRFDAFVGPSYESRSRIADGEAVYNLFPEIVESGQGKNRAVYYGSPGLKTLPNLPHGLPDGPIRGMWSSHQSSISTLSSGADRLFVVGGGTLFEVFYNGAYSIIGNVQNANTPADITSNGSQLFIVSGGKAYVATGTVVNQVNTAATGCYLDSYFIISKPFDNSFYISAINDGMTWDAADFSQKGGYPDHIVRVFSDHKLLWLFGTDTTEVWYDSGSALFPFVPIQGAYIEHGLGASASVAKVGETLMWMEAGERGSGVIYQAQGFIPVRVSNHAVEHSIQTLIEAGIRVDDAIGMSFQDRGHIFYQITFPTANLTWVYDVTTKWWHKRASWKPNLGGWKRHPASCMAYAFGQHFIGSLDDSKIYVQSIQYKDDDGAPIRRLRRAPHLSNENKRMKFVSFQLDLQKGTVPSTGPGSNPIFTMRFSDDGGFTWSNDRRTVGIVKNPDGTLDYNRSTIGLTGEYSHQCVFRQLGSGRDRVFEVESSEPIEHAWIDAYLEIVPSTE